MRRNILIFTALLLCSISSFGQGEIDALRNSRNDIVGTARATGMGGAFGALGGDVTGVAINPGGIGVYRSSEVVATMNFSSTNIKTDWGDQKLKDSKFKFNFDNLAYMGYYPMGSDVFKSFNYGFSFNRLKNFDRNYTARGKNMSRSLTDYMVGITNLVRPAIIPEDLESSGSYDPYNNTHIPWLSTLGWNGYLMEHDNDKKEFYSPLYPGDKVNPSLDVSERGAIDSYDFTAGTNISDMVYLGLTVSLTDIHYSMDSRYSEDIIDDKGAFADKFYLNNYLETKGSGVQVNAGVIFRPVDELRLGVAYHSPTWYNLTDYFQGDTEFGSDKAWTPKAANREYGFHSPSKWVLSAAGVIGTNAIVSLDYEFTDYSSMNLKDDLGYVIEDKTYIDEDFKLASSVRVGLEIRATPQLSLRGGYSWMQNPYEKKFRNAQTEVMTVGTVPHYTIEGDVNYFSIGAGYRFSRNFYLDAAFVLRNQTDNLFAYSNIFSDELGYITSVPAKLTNNMFKGVVTLGYKF